MRAVFSIRYAWFTSAALLGLLLPFHLCADSVPHPNYKPANRTLKATGVVEEVAPRDRLLTVRHDAIEDYMPAMTMPFKVWSEQSLEGLKPGQRISFELHVTADDSWIDQIHTQGAPASVASAPSANSAKPARSPHPLMNFGFTNELGQCVRLSDFHGQALALTFFFTRCPLPNFCPRLSKNFQQAQQKLSYMPGAPTNWHFISVSFDPAYDQPKVLKAYAQQYNYDPRHWSFLTGPEDKIRELALLSDVKYEGTNGVINHNFRTLIIDATGRLQMVFPTGGDLSADIVSEIVKAAAASPHS